MEVEGGAEEVLSSGWDLRKRNDFFKSSINLLNDATASDCVGPVPPTKIVQILGTRTT